MNETHKRSVEAVIPAVRQLEGGGFEVARPFPTAALSQVDPFLLLDHMGPVQLAPGEARGAPDLPGNAAEPTKYSVGSIQATLRRTFNRLDVSGGASPVREFSRGCIRKPGTAGRSVVPG